MMTPAKKLSAIIFALLLLCAVMFTFTAVAEEATHEEIMARLQGYGNEVNESLSLGASRIDWQYIHPTDDPDCWLVAVGTTDNDRTIVLAQGNRILDNQITLYGTWVVKRSTRTDAPTAIGQPCLFGEDITAWAFEGTVTDGRTMVNVKKAWAWFEDGRLISGDLHGKRSNWINLGCHHMFNKSTGELREKVIHSYTWLGNSQKTCHGPQEIYYQCTRCGEHLTQKKPRHNTVTYTGYGTFCVKCGQRVY